MVKRLNLGRFRNGFVLFALALTAAGCADAERRYRRTARAAASTAASLAA